jgi:RND family efflux transporter MFP subunit
MNYPLSADMSFNPRHLIALFFSLVASILIGSVASAQVDGFTEPFRTIELSSDETGSIAELKIEEGASVSKGEVIACLDIRVQELQLEIAEKTANNSSQIEAAEATAEKRRTVARRLRELADQGHARDSELMRAELELSIAEAKLLSAREEKLVHEIEHRRAHVLLDRRRIRAPFDGVIAKVHRQEGEFLSPLRPEIATLVQVDRLLATFMIPSSQVRQFEIGARYDIELENGRVVEATVHSVGVLTDAQSGTVELKLVIENPGNEYRSGEICSLKI